MCYFVLVSWTIVFFKYHSVFHVSVHCIFPIYSYGSKSENDNRTGYSDMPWCLLGAAPCSYIQQLMLSGDSHARPVTRCVIRQNGG